MEAIKILLAIGFTVYACVVITREYRWWKKLGASLYAFLKTQKGKNL